VRITAGTPLAEVAVLVGDALRRHGIRGVLTGGACASLHSRGAYISRDVDFVLPAETTVSDLDLAMQFVGFHRDGSRYVHPESSFYVEFPAGPLAIGTDFAPRPVLVRRGRATALALSATDACRDRLAPFYHWRDRQALDIAVQIALANRIRTQRIREWSAAEGAIPEFETFMEALRMARARSRPR
jgi:hypothetical protein